MPTIHKEQGLRFTVWSNDHEPPHIHVFKGRGAGDAELKIDISDTDAGPQLIENIGMKINDARNAFRIVAKRQEEMLNHWRRIHD